MTGAVTLLGVKGGPSLRKGGPIPSSSRLEMAGATFLIDCGVGATRALVEAGTPLTELDAIFITHLHSDHLLDLGSLLYTAWTSGLRRKIDVYGPEGIEAYWQHFLVAMSFDHGIRTIDDKRAPITDFVEVHTYGADASLTANGVSVKTFRVDHPPVTDSFALRFEAEGASVVFSADTCYFPPLAGFARGSDLLIHEAVLGAGIDALVVRIKGAPGLRDHLIASHTMVEDVGRIAAEADVGQLVLNHLVPADDPNFSEADWIEAIRQTWDGPVKLGFEGLTVPIKTKVLQ